MYRLPQHYKIPNILLFLALLVVVVVGFGLPRLLSNSPRGNPRFSSLLFLRTISILLALIPRKLPIIPLLLLTITSSSLLSFGSFRFHSSDVRPENPQTTITQTIAPLYLPDKQQGTLQHWQSTPVPHWTWLHRIQTGVFTRWPITGSDKRTHPECHNLFSHRLDSPQVESSESQLPGTKQGIPL
jgi:hypothetical protein